MEHYSEEQIKSILESYQKKRIREKKYYNSIKDTEEFKQKNRKMAKDWYVKNSDLRKQQYVQNNELQRAKVSYHYYNKLNRVEDFKKKSPDKYQLLLDNHYISEANPDSSITNSPSSSDAEPSQ